jgi:polyribonucleotide 5'-hydroxyl-kinase
VQGGFTIPGTLTACPIDSPIPTSSPANPLGITATSAPTALSSSKLIPLIHWYGHSDIRKNPRLVERLIRVLNDEIAERLETDILGKSNPELKPDAYSGDFIARTSGLFIDTPHNFTSASLDDKHTLVKAAVHAFQGPLSHALVFLTSLWSFIRPVNTIIVIGNEKLTVEMQKLFAEGASENYKVTVLKIPRSPGVVELDSAYRDRVQGYQLKNYFFGSPLQLPEELASQPLNSLNLGGEAAMDLTLSPHSSVISFDDLHIYRIGQGMSILNEQFPG